LFQFSWLDIFGLSGEGIEMKIIHVRFKDGFGAAWLRKIVAVAVSFLIIISMTGTLLAVDNLIDHHGLVLTNPRLFIIYWGGDWSNGFQDATSGLSSYKYQSYLENFLNTIGGGSWIATQKQYRNATSPPNVISGIWVDIVNPLPTNPSEGQIEEEVRRAAEYFNVSSDPQAVYLIALPPGHQDLPDKVNGSGAWHSWAFNNNIFNKRDYPYITLPYNPPGWGANLVNASFDSSGHGIFDGVSIVVGHEWVETLTDPRDEGWYDDIWDNLNKDGGETGDKCNKGGFHNIAAGGDYFAVQPLWSNNDGGCVLAGTPTKDQSPTSYDFAYVARYTLAGPTIVQLTNNGDIDLPFFSTQPWFLTGANAGDFLLYGNTCKKFLPPTASCYVDVYFRPTDFGPRQAVLGITVPNYIAGGNTTTLNGQGVSQWFFVDPPNETGIVLGNSLIHNSTNSAPVQLRNTGAIPQLIQNVGLGGTNPSDFHVLRNDCTGRELGPSESCAVVLSFTPTATGARQAEMEFTDAAGNAFSVPVLGTGLGPVGQLSATEIIFDGIKYNSDGVTTGAEIPVTGALEQAITLTNIGQSPLQVNGVEATGDFAPGSNGCALPLQPNESCVIQVRVVPTQFAFQSGTLMIYDNTSDSPHEVKLTGSVDAPIASLVKDELRFGSVQVGSMSSPQTVELENLEGEAPLQIQSISATGDFTATSDCPIQLAIGRCTITVTMKPTATGLRNGRLVVVDNAPQSPQMILLLGTGLPGNCNDKNNGKDKSKGKGHDKGKCRGHDKG